MHKKIAVLGSGSWGTALAHHVRRSTRAIEKEHAGTSFDVCIWGRDSTVLTSIEEKATNPRYLVGLSLASGIRAEADIQQAVKDAFLIVIAVPSSVLRAVVEGIKEQLKESRPLILSGIKGLERESYKTATEVLHDILGDDSHLAALGGPSFAAELVEGYPTAVTIAAYEEETARQIQEVVHYGNVRAYTAEDVLGVEYGGAVKNVMALATGMLDGVGMGHNARAALITRGLAEIKKLVEALGGDERTISGLAGLGDLLLTAVGDLSRNRQVGLRLGRGESLDAITKDLGQVAEGVRSAQFVLQLAKNHKVDMPIVEQTVAVLDGKHGVEEAIGQLLAREPKTEIKEDGY